MNIDRLHQAIHSQDSRFEPHRGICIVWRHAPALVECAKLLKSINDCPCDEIDYEKLEAAIKRLEEQQ